MKPDDPDRDTMVDAKRTRLGVVARTTDPRDKDLVGTMFGGYLVAGELGGGAMGLVYRASHLDTNRVVALKTRSSARRHTWRPSKRAATMSTGARTSTHSAR